MLDTLAGIYYKRIFNTHFSSGIYMIFKKFQKSFAPTAALLLTAILLFSPLTGSAEMLDRVVAVVNDDIITLSELEESGSEYINKVKQRAPVDQQEEAVEQAQMQVLTKLITQRLITQKATEAGIKVSDAEVEEFLEQKRQEMGLSPDELRDKLKQSGLTEDIYKTDLRNELLRGKLISYEVRSKVIITDEMIKEYYETEYADEVGDGGFYLLQMGFVWETESDSEQSAEALEKAKAKALERAQETRKRVVDGGDFGKLAQQYSDLASADDGGDLGVFQKDELAPYMRDAILSLKVGEVSPIIDTPIGYQFFKLLSKESGEKAKERALEAIKEDIRNKLMQEKFKEEYAKWVEELQNKSYIKRML